MTTLDATLSGLASYFEANPDYPNREYVHARCRAMLRVYVAWYEKSDRADYEVLGVEELLTGPILNPANLKDSGYLAAGKIDVRAIQRKHNKRVIIDHKCLSGEMDDYHHQHLLVDTQPMQYALLEYLNGRRIDAAVWDVIAKSGHKPRKSGDTPEAFEQRIFEIYTEDPAAYFARKEIPILQYNLTQYAVELHSWTKIMHSARLGGDHLKTPESCFNFHRPCRYLDICSGRVDMIRGVQAGTFVKIDEVHPELELPPETDPREVVTNSRLKTFRSCMFKHDLQYNIGLRKKNERPDEPLYIGSAIHKGLEHYWLSLKGGE